MQTMDIETAKKILDLGWKYEDLDNPYTFINILGVPIYDYYIHQAPKEKRLTIRAYSVLKQCKVKSVLDLYLLNKYRISNIKGCGERTIQQIEKFYEDVLHFNLVESTEQSIIRLNRVENRLDEVITDIHNGDKQLTFQCDYVNERVREYHEDIYESRYKFMHLRFR